MEAQTFWKVPDHHHHNPYQKQGSVLDNGNSYTSGRHASLLAGTNSRSGNNIEPTQLREGVLSGTLAGHKINYLDSGYSEEDADQQITSCLMKTSSGSIYIPPNLPKNSTTMDSRLEYRFGVQTPSHSPTKESLKNSERSTLQYTSADTPFLPVRNNLLQQRCNGRGSSPPRFEKNFARKCSWRCVAIFFVVLALILSAALAYITASSFLPVSYESAKACAVVVEQNDARSNLEPEIPKEYSAASSAASSAVIPSVLGQVKDEEDIPKKPRNLPPDGTTFSQISLGKRLEQTLPAYGYWNVQFYQMEAAFVNVDLKIPKGASLGFYARRNALPTHTNYDLMEVVKGVEEKSRSTRAAMRSMEKRLSLFMSEGHWFISMYNDFGDAQMVEFLAAPSIEMTEGCPNGCNSHGECVLGRCQCQSGYGGDDCSQGSCPLLCGGHGDYVNGECDCQPGWKGKECSLRHDECEVSDCSGHGHCQEGRCVCMKGFTGEFCQKVDCSDPTCAGHGFCVDGACICKKGWKGPDCSLLDEDARQCLPDCSSNGKFDLELQQCVCHEGWVGEDCASKLCDLDCGEHGRCEDVSCVCADGWTGARCQDRGCDPRCSLHGQCKNGTCLCVTGWNGIHCTLEGCPKACSSRGLCKANLNGEWACECQEGWEGPDCSVRLERLCDDGKDDDQDGLTDCEDPECCENPVCKNSQLCTTVARPIDILLQRQPPSSTASFFQKMRFIIEEGSLQRYAKNTAFNESRAAVIRGRVLTNTGRGLVGVRVTHADLHNEGYTMTQEDGWFDFMVNGGGAVTLKFGKSPFPPQVRTLFAPWNEVVIIEPVVMSMEREKPESTFSLNNNLNYANTTSSICLSHDYETMRPIVMASWRLGSQTTASGDKSGIVVESRVIREVIPIPNSRLGLVYHSGRARGYLSTLELRLTPEKIPSTLKTIQLRITIEGVLFEKTFEADPSLKYTYSWKRLNIYRQRVYGTTTAVVKVGYTYEGCDKTVWNIQATKISGQDLTVSDVGGWDLNLHHRYNPQEGILYRGDGSNVFLRERPRLIFDLMGDGKRRNIECPDSSCHSGPVEEQRLLSPVALASASDGSVYVGDYNLIRRIHPDRTVSTVLKLKSSGMAYRYHLSINPHDDTVYVSDPESHRVIRIKNVDDPVDIETNFDPVIGSGIRCLPGDGDSCGDGGPARDARLFYPKGVAISADRKLYLADGTTIRIVDEEGIIDTLIGSKFPEKLWKPMACGGTTRLEDAALRWPTEMAVHPLDNSLYFVDDGIVAKITTDGRLQMVAGRPLHCRPSEGASAASGSFFNFASQSTLVSPTSLSFSLQGDLYLAESDSRRINRISVVGTDGRIRAYAGKDSKCNCQDADCVCYDKDVLLATEALFGSISSVTVSPDGRLYIADLAGRRVRVVESNIPTLNADQEYEVYSPETQEVYIFNRFGLHSETKNIPSGKTVLKYSYSVSTSNGKLIGIEDASGGKIKIARDYSGQATSIENTLRQRFVLQLDRKKMLTKFTRPDNSAISFSYTRSSELIRSRKDSGDGGATCVYEYDDNGRLVSTVTSSGEHFGLVSDLDLRGAMVNVSLNGRENVLSLLMQPRLVQELVGGGGESIKMDSDRSFILETRWGRKIRMKTSTYPLLEDDQAAQSYPIPVSETTDIGRDTVSRYDWQYYVTPATGRVGKKLKVSGEPIISVELNRQTESQVLMLESAQAMLNSSDGPQSLRINMLPSGLFAGVNVEKNRLGQPILWRWGDLAAEFKYDSSNRLTELRSGTNSVLSYVYNDDKSTEPEKIVVPSGGAFVYHHNDIGGLEYVMTPRGHIHGFSSQYALGFKRFVYSSPWSRQPYELHVDYSGRIVAKVLPQEKHKTIYVYDQASGKLESAVGGSRAVEYKYFGDTGLLRTVRVSEEELLFNMKIDLRYHLGVLKEQQISFDKDNKIALDQILMRYTYDGSARLAGIVTQIGQQDNESVLYKYKSGGRLEVIKDLRIRYESFRRTVMEDAAKTYSYTKDLDAYGRLDGVVMRINGYEQLRIKYAYDTENRVASKSSTLGGSEVKTQYIYNIDGQLQSVKSDDGVDDWTFTHDVNGNVVGVKMAENRINIGMDGGDRVVSYGDLDFVSYDDRGYVTRRKDQRYRYNSFGQMISAHEPGKFAVRFYYDDLGRIAAKRDHRGNVVQFIYSNPYSNSTVSHVHYPKASRTYHLLYDENDFLVAMDTPDSRFYIATDHLGSPMAVFDYKGKLVKEISRSPFGRVTRDTNPTMDLPIDFAGGLIDQYAHLIHIGGRVYDPLLGQWMTPAWEKVGDTRSRSPYDIFAYRFFNNDPVNPTRSFIHMTGLNEWLNLFGLNLARMFGTHYTTWSHHKPDLFRPSEFDITVGLANQQRQAAENLLNPSLVSNGLLTSESFNLPEIFSRIATKASAFGRGLLLTDLAGKAVVTLVEDGTPGDVVQSVFASILNASYVLDISHSGKEEYYFLKPELSSFQTDFGELQRLSGSYNISYDNVRSTDGKELCAQNRLSTVCLMYGLDRRTAGRYVHRRAHKQAVQEAWKREVELLKEPSAAILSPWSPAERMELAQRGEVNGYTAVEIHSVHKYPQLIGQSSNIKFFKDEEAKTWHTSNQNKSRRH